MRVRFLVSMAGVGSVRDPGDVAECSPGEAARLIAAGFAEPADPPATVPPEKPHRAKPGKPEKADHDPAAKAEKR
ncbi:MAG: hypothetical protein JWO31_994 [Phycisphaerales bacterium]|nr:hypothetical protein [Phycisphaerales bacterium]